MWEGVGEGYEWEGDCWGVLEAYVEWRRGENVIREMWPAGIS